MPGLKWSKLRLTMTSDEFRIQFSVVAFQILAVHQKCMGTSETKTESYTLERKKRQLPCDLAIHCCILGLNT